MHISVVICTHNRSSRLRKCLDSVVTVTAPAGLKWELVVVNSASTDDTAAVIQDFARRAPMPVTIVTETRRGSGRARNAGWHAARGDIIAFTDDDCYVAEDYVERLAEAFADEHMGYLGGRIKLYDSEDYAYTIKDSADTELFGPCTFMRPGELHGANIAFRRSVLERINGFDPDLGAGAPFSGDDMDTCTRASFAGERGAYVPAVVVFHHHRRKAKDIPALRRRYAFGRGAYMVRFILRPDTRTICFRQWWWRLRIGLARPNERRACLQELIGGAHYIFYRLSQRLRYVGSACQLRRSRASSVHVERFETSSKS